MKFLADECCDAGLVKALREDDHDLVYAVESMRGATDDEILTRAHTENRVLLTEDKDFGELVYRLRKPAYGVILLRFAVPERGLKIPRLRSFLEAHAEQVPGAFIVVEAEKVRMRPLSP